MKLYEFESQSGFTTNEKRQIIKNAANHDKSKIAININTPDNRCIILRFAPENISVIEETLKDNITNVLNILLLDLNNFQNWSDQLHQLYCVSKKDTSDERLLELALSDIAAYKNNTNSNESYISCLYAMKDMGLLM